jgi:hypothetical protein
MALVVILEPSRQLGQDRLSIRAIVNIHVIPLEGFNERLCHPVRLGTAHWREARHQAQSGREVDRLMRTVTAPVVREPLDGVWQRIRSEAPLDALHHQVADHFPAHAASARAPGHDFPVARIQGEGRTHDLAVPARDLEAIGCPAQVRADRDDLPVVSPARRLPGVSLQQHAVLRHQAIDAFMINPRKACFKPFSVQQRGDPPVAVGRGGSPTNERNGASRSASSVMR